MAGQPDDKDFYLLLFLLIIIGPTVYILNLANVGVGYWLDRFWTWGLDPYIAGGKALVTWWTMYDWAIWIAYAPLMGIFFAMIAYGRTVKQFCSSTGSCRPSLALFGLPFGAAPLLIGSFPAVLTS